MFTDGFIKQIGFENNKKFMKIKLKHLLNSISKEPLKTQKEILEKTFNDWKGNNEQIDDILITGISF